MRSDVGGKGVMWGEGGDVGEGVMWGEGGDEDGGKEG